MSIEEYVADEGDHCDGCGALVPEGAPLWTNTSIPARYWFCSVACCEGNPTEQHSPKLRFIRAVLG